jgi:hypothetical protein
MADTKQIYASKGSTQYKPYSVASDAPLTAYNVPGHNLNTWSMNDTGGQQWYLTDGGNWRNTKTKALQSTMPTYAAPTPAPVAAAPAPAPVAPAPAVPAPAPQTWKSINDFMPTANQDLFKPQAQPELGNYTMAAPTAQPVVQGQVANLNIPNAPQMKSYMDFLPQNWQNSAAYDYQMKMGNQELDRRLSAMGLSGSGADLESRTNLAGKASADEVARLMQAATESYNLYGQSALSNQNAMQDGAMRTFDASNASNQNYANAQNQMSQLLFGAQNDANKANFDANISKDNLKYSTANNNNQNLMQTISQLMGTDFQAYQANQQNAADREVTKDGQSLGAIQTALDYIKSLNPMQYGFQATNTVGQNQLDLASKIAALQGGGGGGGGGGGSRPPAVPAPTSPGPGGFDSTNYWLQAGSKLVPALLNGFGLGSSSNNSNTSTSTNTSSSGNFWDGLF